MGGVHLFEDIAKWVSGHMSGVGGGSNKKMSTNNVEDLIGMAKLGI